jgi:NADH-quinone oxidoreductase subunit E
MFYTRPVGRFVIQVCRTLSCALMGAERVTEAFKETLGIEVGGTDATGTFTLLEVECLGACDRGPVLLINDSWHELQSPETAGKLLEELRDKGEVVLSGCHLDVERATGGR